MTKPTLSNPEGIAHRCSLPDDELKLAWSSIKLPEGMHERLLSQSLLSFTIRQKLPFEVAPLHGLILLTGPPGTGKTTVGRGLANQIAKQLRGSKSTYVEVDPHGLMSSAHGRSQQAVAKLFEQTIPELAINGPALVLLDEIETLVVSRHKLSLEANPIDVHRATDAALAGLDRLTREHKNVLLIATTNFAKVLDQALLSRADHIEEFELPNEAARREIILDTLSAVGKVWRKVRNLEKEVDPLAKAAEGLDGRRIRKQIFVAMGSDLKTASDPDKLTKEQIQAAFKQARKSLKEIEQ
jgi:AAA+ superfamily predicted ATPase